MKSVIGSALILVSLYLGYTGITKMSNSEKSVEIIGIELSASDEDKKSTGIIYLGLSVVSMIGGVTLLARN